MSDAASLAGLADTLFTVTILVYSLATIAFAATLAFSRQATASQHRDEGQRAEPRGREHRPSASEGGADRPVRGAHEMEQPSGGSAEPTNQIQVLDETNGSRFSSRASTVAMGITVVGALLHGSVLLLRGLAAQRVPLGNMFEFATAVAFVGVVGFLYLALRTPRLRGIGLYVTLPITVALVLVGLFLYAESGPLVAALRSRWLVVHVTTVSIGFGAFLTSGILSALFLARSRFEDTGQAAGAIVGRIGHRLPASQTLDRAAHRMVVFGFPIFTFAVIAGAVWAESAWGRFWGWDPKETWAFVAWIVYAAYLHARATAGWKGRAAAWINVAGLVVMLFNLLYVNLVTTGLHSYAGVS
ncbi:MAG: c-type cytochrome biogenesis protein CcsB [Actinomycetota bacterium]|nr:c-type cytochrome biogenesis protein CcsB [Actinomycetota bacterium]